MSEYRLKPGFHPISNDELPDGWTAVALEKLVSVSQGGRFGLTKERDYIASGVAAYSASGQDGYVERAEFRNQPGVVLSAIGANCGRCFYAEGDWTTLANVQAIIPNGELDARFLYYRTNIENYWTRSGSAQPFIKPSSIKKSWIALPPPFQQRQIAEILGTVDEAIEQTEALIAKQQQMKAGLMHDLFTRGVTPAGHLRRCREEAPHLYQEFRLGWVPKEWETSQVSAEFTIDSGITLGPHRRPNLSPYPYLRVGNVYRDRIVLDEVSLLEATPAEAETKRLKPYDLLIVEGHANRYEIGRCAMVLSDAEGMLFQNHLFRLRPSRLNPRFSLLWLNSAFAQLYWDQKCATSSGLNTINRRLLGAMPVFVPSLNEQRRIEEILFTHRERESATTAHLAKLRQLKQGLMQDLLTGRVPVAAAG